MTQEVTMFDRIWPFIQVICGALIGIAFTVAVIMVPDVLAKTDTTPWVLYIPGLCCMPCVIITMGATPVVDSAWRRRVMIYPSCDALRRGISGSPVLFILFNVSIFFALLFNLIGMPIYVAHRVPYTRLVNADVIKGGLESVSARLVSERASMVKTDKVTKIYLSDGFVDLDHAFAKTTGNYDPSSGDHVPEYRGIAPVYASPERGDILAWVIQTDKDGFRQDICTKGPNAMHGLCGQPIRSSEKNGVRIENFVFTGKSHYSFSSGEDQPFFLEEWKKKWPKQNQKAEAAEAELDVLPILHFKDPDEEQLEISKWVTLGLVIFFVGVVSLIVMFVILGLLYSVGLHQE